jgi:hypothetical protein
MDYDVSIAVTPESEEPQAEVPDETSVDVRVGNDARAREHGRSRIWLLLALLAAVLVATWYYGYVPIEITNTFGIPRRG